MIEQCKGCGSAMQFEGKCLNRACGFCADYKPAPSCCRGAPCYGYGYGYGPAQHDHGTGCPAQPAARTPDHHDPFLPDLPGMRKPCGCLKTQACSYDPQKPAAPEPSADQCRLGWKREYERAESAEAQLAAVRAKLQDRDVMPVRRIMQALALLTAPSPGAGGPEICDVCNMPQTLCDKLSARGTDPTPGRSGK